MDSQLRQIPTPGGGYEEIEVLLAARHRREEFGERFPPPDPSSAVVDGVRADRDVSIELSDGTTIYADIYRPEGASGLPAIVAWSPYGKREGYAGRRAHGVPEGTCSPATKFEGPDPFYWCRYGYAVVNPDARGSGDSEGDILMWSSAEGRDCYDLVEWVAAQPWCSGKVGMSGNSWLAVAQWFAAAAQPPHLACIAPWEGLSDLYRELACPGGIREVGFLGHIVDDRLGLGRAEQVVAMAEAHPFLDAYWQDKIPAFEAISVPAYVAAGWSHFHLRGSIRAFRSLASSRKWLRIHREFEWPDYYAPENIADLRLFFDRYLMGIRNGWELTPPVRLDVMDAGEDDHVRRRPESSFPLERAEQRHLYLDAATGSLAGSPPAAPAAAFYDAASGEAVFDVRFTEDTEVTGYMSVSLTVEADAGEDIDLFVTVLKLSAGGSELPTFVLGRSHPGTWGMLRASHRELEPGSPAEGEPVHAHRRALPVVPGEPVELEIGLVPTSRLWHAGETLRLRIAGRYIREPGWFEAFSYDTRNSGRHTIHTGGERPAYLSLPIVPARAGRGGDER